MIWLRFQVEDSGDFPFLVHFQGWFLHFWVRFNIPPKNSSFTGLRSLCEKNHDSETNIPKFNSTLKDAQPKILACEIPSMSTSPLTSDIYLSARLHNPALFVYRFRLHNPAYKYKSRPIFYWSSQKFISIIITFISLQSVFFVCLWNGRDH